MGVALRHVSTLAVTLPAVGCFAVKYTPALDSELTEEGAALLASASVVGFESEGAGDWDTQLLVKTTSDNGTEVGTLENRVTSWQRWDLSLPWLLTLGLVPDGGDVTYEFVGTIGRDDGAHSLQLEYSATHVSGWWACVLWASPNWERHSRSSKKDVPLATRAFYTAINQLAEERGGPGS